MARGRRRFRVPAEPPTGMALTVLLAINAVGFGLWWWLGVNDPWLRTNLLVSDQLVFSGRVWTLLTSEFSHANPMHLLFNLLALWVFGRDVESVIGPMRFAMVYVLGGIAASSAHVVWNVLVSPGVPALGASGAVMAVAVLYGALFPTRTLMINFFLPVPAALAVGLYVVLDVLGVLQGGGSTAHAAHLGGAAVGFATWWSIRSRLRRG